MKSGVDCLKALADALKTCRSTCNLALSSFLTPGHTAASNADLQANHAQNGGREVVAFSPGQAEERQKKRPQETATQSSQETWTTVVGRKVKAAKAPEKMGPPVARSRAPRPTAAEVKNHNPAMAVGKTVRG